MKKDYRSEFTVDDVRYPIAFTINVMEEIQEEYGTIDKWSEMTDAHAIDGKEFSAKALKFGYTSMINEGIDIENEETDIKREHLTLKQVGRIITSFGIKESAIIMNNAVIESTKDDSEKNV